MKKKIIDVFLMALLLTVTVGSVVSCKDTDEDALSDIRGQLNENSTLSEAIQAQVETLENTVGQLETAKTNIESDIAALKEQIGTGTDISGRLATAESSLAIIEQGIRQINEALGNADDPNKNLITVFDELSRTLAQIKAQADVVTDLQSRVTTNEEEIAALKEILSDGAISGWSEKLQAVADSAAKALAYAYADSIRLDGVEGNVDALMENVASVLKDAEGNWMTLEEYLDKQLAEIQGEGGEGLTLADLKASYEAADKLLRDDLDALTERVDALETLTSDINDRLGLLESLINKFVTSVIVQGTENPVYGSFSLPFGITSNVLAAYYGDPTDFVFPVSAETDPTPYVFGTERDVLTNADLAILGVDAIQGSGRIISRDGKPGNAGTLYLTVNPNTADLTGAVATLVNSQDVKSGVQLASLTPSDKVLDFGYTRAANNGFYEAQATVGTDAVELVSPRISYEDLRGLKDEIKDAYNAIRNNGNVDVAGLVSSIYGLCSNVLDANAVKFAWTDGEGKEHATYSKYELAATAVKPLSYAFAKDFEIDRVPGLDQVENIVGDIFDKIRNALPEFDTDGLDIEIDEIKLSEVNVGKVTTTVTIDMSDVIDPSTGEAYPDRVVEVDITDAVQEAMDNAMGGIQGDLNDFVASLNEQIGQLNDLIDQLNQINDIGTTVDDIEDQLLDYLNRANNVAIKFINNANELLQPMMLAQTGESFVVLSSSKDAPTLFNAATYSDGLNLYATSYTTEILAPAYKKLVGVTNVFKGNASAQGGNSDCWKALQTVKDASTSCGMYQILEGDRANVQLKGMQEGYVYEIAYTAVDYSGKVVVKKLYVKLADKK